MEQERLARLAARKREQTISPPPRKRARLEGPAVTATVQDGRKDGPTCAPPTTTSHMTNGPSNLRFPRGAVKKTYSPYHPKDDRTTTIDEIIDKDNVHTAVLSSFLINPDWILAKKFNLKKTKFYMILHAKTQAEREMYREDFDGVQQARLCLPKLSGMIGSMHSKLMLLFFAGFLRVVMPSANLVDFDWGETGVMENSVFVIDLARRADNGKTHIEDMPPFGRSLLRFLGNQGLQKEVIESLSNFDFEPTKRLAFVHTSAGSHFDRDVHYTGLPGLSAAVRELGLQTDEDIQIDFAASSLGILKDETVNSIYEAAQGKDITTTASRERVKKPSAKVKANMRIYFPTHDTVKTSIGGPDNGGTICLSAEYWYSPNFPRDMLRDHRSARQGLLSHNKIMLVRGRKKDGKPVAWAYVGSANCSDSAWGKMTTKNVKLNCNNWECGVIVPIEDPPEDMSDLGETFRSVLDVPFEYGEGKGLEYGGRKPWFFKGDR
jgi:hypothetical protein